MPNFSEMTYEEYMEHIGMESIDDDDVNEEQYFEKELNQYCQDKSVELMVTYFEDFDLSEGDWSVHQEMIEEFIKNIILEYKETEGTML